MEGVDLLAGGRDERDVDRPARLVAGDDHEVRELRAALVLPERRDLERREHGLVERDAAAASRTGLDVVEDDPVQSQSATAGS